METGLYAMFFACLILLRLLHFLRLFFLRKTLRAFEWKPGFSYVIVIVTSLAHVLSGDGVR